MAFRRQSGVLKPQSGRFIKTKRLGQTLRDNEGKHKEKKNNIGGKNIEAC